MLSIMSFKIIIEEIQKFIIITFWLLNFEVWRSLVLARSYPEVRDAELVVWSTSQHVLFQFVFQNYSMK